jgi:hypothetical protein
LQGAARSEPLFSDWNLSLTSTTRKYFSFWVSVESSTMEDPMRQKRDEEKDQNENKKALRGDAL